MNMSIDEAQKLYSTSQIEIIDIRTEKEWKMTGIIPNTHLVNMHNEDFSENTNFISEVEKILNKYNNKNIGFICASGSRSEIVASYFLEKKYKNIVHIPDGIIGKSKDGWLYLGFPIKAYNEEKENN